MAGCDRKGVNVVILGGGIGGLSTAHTLITTSKESGFPINVTVIERHSIVGGMARSSYLKNNYGSKLPTEYCWRIYGPEYKNVRKLMSEIPDGKGYVIDNLIDVSNYLIFRDDANVSHNEDGYFILNNGVSDALSASKKINVGTSDKFNILNKYLYGLISSQHRLDTELANISWMEFNKDISNDFLRKLIIKSTGPFLGADLYRVSASSILRELENFQLINAKPLSVMGKPTNEGWFDPWKKYLESMGVVFMMDTTVELINSQHIENQERITSIDVSRDGNIRTIEADYFVCSLPIEVASKLLPRSTYQHDTGVDLKYVADQSPHLMFSVFLYFNDIYLFKKDREATKTGFYLPDSPWQLVIEPQGTIWPDSLEPNSEGIRDVWSVGVCDEHSPGMFKKSIKECTREEIIEDVIDQIFFTSSMVDNFYGEITNQKLRRESIVRKSMWETYRYDEKAKRLTTYEPKFSSNSGTWLKRPTITTNIPNLFYATAYVKTQRSETFLMDVAAYAGISAGEHIISDINSKRSCAIIPAISSEEDIRKYDTILFPLRQLDSVLSRNGRGHISDYFGGSSLIVVIIYTLLIIFVAILVVYFLYRGVARR